eukprot:SAG31_NODE_363_length_16899_cov_9.812976_11_plen_74_part_00
MQATRDKASWREQGEACFWIPRQPGPLSCCAIFEVGEGIASDSTGVGVTVQLFFKVILNAVTVYEFSHVPTRR